MGATVIAPARDDEGLEQGGSGEGGEQWLVLESF